MNLMMGENNLSEGYKKSRAVLGDVTNQLGKRGLASIASNLGLQYGNGNLENFDKKVRDNLGSKVLHLNEKLCGKRAFLFSRPSSGNNPLKENVITEASKAPNEIKDPKLSDIGVGSSGIHAAMQAGEDSRSSCEGGTSMLVNKSESGCVYVEVICDSEGGRVVSHKGFQDKDTHLSENDDGDVHGVDNWVQSQTGSVDCARIQESQESRNFELERCSGLKADGCYDLKTNNDLIKSCSCSFCTKAGYVWLDLQYQDMKGRIAALKKSQKDASILVERSCRIKGIDKHGQGSSGRQANLEHDLMAQWRSLFVHMGEIFQHEGNQLESSLHSLKDLRDRCKTELEVINDNDPETQL